MKCNFPRLASLLATIAIDRFARRREPDFVVGADDVGGPYLNRWFVTPWRPWQRQLRERAQANPTRFNRAVARVVGWLPNLYVHQFLRDDDDRALHDHPSWAASLILRNRYIEHTIAAGGIHRREVFDAGSLRFLPTRHTHRIELEQDPRHFPIECWTLFLFGPAVREWGFHCPEAGWIHWREFTAPDNPGETGRGCD